MLAVVRRFGAGSAIICRSYYCSDFTLWLVIRYLGYEWSLWPFLEINNRIFACCTRLTSLRKTRLKRETRNIEYYGWGRPRADLDKRETIPCTFLCLLFLLHSVLHVSFSVPFFIEGIHSPQRRRLNPTRKRFRLCSTCA